MSSKKKKFVRKEAVLKVPRETLKFAARSFFIDPEQEIWKFEEGKGLGRQVAWRLSSYSSFFSCFALLLLNSCAFNRHKLLVRQQAMSL